MIIECIANQGRNRFVIAAFAATLTFASALPLLGQQASCEWVGTVYDKNMGAGQFDPAAPVWGDPQGWATTVGLSAGIPGTCFGLFPGSTKAIPYNVTILDSKAPAVASEIGNKSLVLISTTAGTSLHPSINSLLVGNSTIAGSLMTGHLSLENSTLLGSAQYVVQSEAVSSPVNTLNNTSLTSADLIFSGHGAAALFTGAVNLDQTTRTGRSGSPVNGPLASITGSASALTTFQNVTISAGTLSHPTGAIIETGGGMQFTGVNTVTGATLNGNFQVKGDPNVFNDTTFNGTALAGTISASTGLVYFNGGTMSGAMSGFFQSGLANVHLDQFSASGGQFGGNIHYKAVA